MPAVQILSQRQNPFERIKQDFSVLANALQSGDLAGAQYAYSNLQQLVLAYSSPSTSSSGSNTPTTVLALRAGNLTQS